MNTVKLKRSRQRDAILTILNNTTSHPTAEEVYCEVRKQIPNISLGTVYRNLSLLSDMGIILKLDVGDEFVHFDGNSHPHYHLFCRECKRVYDFSLEYNSKLDEEARQNFGGEIDGHNLVFTGVCETCK